MQNSAIKRWCDRKLAKRCYKNTLTFRHTAFVRCRRCSHDIMLQSVVFTSRWTPNTPLIITSPSFVLEPGGNSFQWPFPQHWTCIPKPGCSRILEKCAPEVGVLHTRSENEERGREAKEGEYRSEERNLVFEQGQECPARGGISAGEEDRASAGKNSVGLNWPRSAGWAGEGARHDGSRMFALTGGMLSPFRLIRRKSLLSVA